MKKNPCSIDVIKKSNVLSSIDLNKSIVGQNSSVNGGGVKYNDRRVPNKTQEAYLNLNGNSSSINKIGKENSIPDLRILPRQQQATTINKVPTKRGCDDDDPNPNLYDNYGDDYGGNGVDDVESQENGGDDALSTNFLYGLRPAPAKKPRFVITYAEMKEYFSLLNEESIQQFLKRDSCCLISDKVASFFLHSFSS